MITLYTATTGNGYRVAIMLEEVGLPYDVVAIGFGEPEKIETLLRPVNPMAQIPAITDSDGPGGAAIALSESSAILRYLARKTGKLLPQGAMAEMEADRWTAIVSGGFQAAPTTIFFARMYDVEKHAELIAKNFEYIDRYLALMEARLAVSPYLAGPDFTYVDILGFSLAQVSLPRFDIGFDNYPAISAWRDAVAARPAVQRGLKVPA